jgi:hypothetical protein
MLISRPIERCCPITHDLIRKTKLMFIVGTPTLFNG